LHYWGEECVDGKVRYSVRLVDALLLIVCVAPWGGGGVLYTRLKQQCQHVLCYDGLEAARFVKATYCTPRDCTCCLCGSGVCVGVADCAPVVLWDSVVQGGNVSPSGICAVRCLAPIGRPYFGPPVACVPISRNISLGYSRSVGIYYPDNSVVHSSLD
jgi:hypothetical protein